MALQKVSLVSRGTMLLSYVLLASLMCSCAGTPKKTVEAPKKTVEAPNVENILNQALADANAGKTEKATNQLKYAARLFPTDKRPLLKLAQMNFDGANYGEAITYAKEVLQLDATDKVANSIIAVSGLRLSTKALADLSQQNNLNGSVRTEAQDLAKLLRESLGESVLVPTSGNTPPKPKKVLKKASSTASKPAGDVAGDPFGSLK